MPTRCRLEMLTVLVVASIVAAACSGSSKTGTHNSTTTTLPTPTRSVTVDPLAVSAPTTGPPSATGGPAGSGAIAVSIRPAADGKLHVGFRGNAAGAAGSQWRAAGWSAVATATLLTGAPLANREIDFSVSGASGAAGAGALMTIAVLALLRGDALEPGITITGTIAPDGTIGPVAGVPEAVTAAGLAHDTRMLIPVGERSSRDQSGKIVDVVAAGRRAGVTVTQTPSVYDAYRKFTGKPLPRVVLTDAKLSSAASDKLRTEVETWLAKYASALTDFQSLSPGVQRDLAPYADTAAAAEEQAKQLTGDGLQAGAFDQSVQAAALMNAIAQAGQSFPVLLAQGPKPFVAKIRASQSIGAEITGLTGELASFAPQTVSDASALTAAYANAIDALSLSRLAGSLFSAPAFTAPESLTQAAEGAIDYDLAGSLVDASNDILSSGEGLSGPPLDGNVDMADAASFFRLAAEANLAVFRQLVVVPFAKARHVTDAVAAATLAASNSLYALAANGDRVLRALPSYFGTGTHAAYAQLGGARALYARTAELAAEYSPLGTFDPATLDVTGIANGTAFNSMIGLARSQLVSSIGALRTKGADPVTAAADNEVGSVEAAGSTNDRFDALGSYWDGYLGSRLLAYLGGFAATTRAPVTAPTS
jgi:uncharacterized protein